MNTINQKVISSISELQSASRRLRKVYAVLHAPLNGQVSDAMSKIGEAILLLDEVYTKTRPQ